ncbi:MAG: DUF2326 domain-containing protein [Flavobacteriaceae bacterium]|nr:DUF2326 domain-containing protein [Flavobacteriaceae bacterium]
MVIRLIDFALLSGKAEKVFAQKKYRFLREDEHSISLEFKVGQKTYFLKRFFSDLDIIHFGDNSSRLEEFQKSALNKILEGIFFPTQNNKVFFEGKRYRTLMEFFIKDNLQNQQRVDPLNFFSYNANSREKALYSFYLLNVPTKNIVQFNKVSNDYDLKKKTLKVLTEKFQTDTGKGINEFRSEILKIEKKIHKLEDSLNNYDFLETHQDIQVELNKVINQINKKSTVYHTTNRELEKLKTSYSDVSNIDVDKIKKLYNDTKSKFGSFVKKTLDEVIEFKKQLLENRYKYLLDQENKLTRFIETTLKELEDLEKRRSVLLLSLKEKGALDKIESTFEKLIEEKTQLEQNMTSIKQIEEIKTFIAMNNAEITKIILEIVNEVKRESNKLDELRYLFQEILDNAIYLDENHDKSYFDVTLQPSKRNQLPFSINVQIPKADALGQERLKIVSYDLMVFLNSRRNHRRNPDFLIHDGVFHAISKETIFNVLNYVYHEANRLQNFQYVLTFNEDEIDFYGKDISEVEKLKFDIFNHIIVELSDDEEKTLFKRFF